MKKAPLIRVVDDDQSVRNGLEYLLISEGYEVALFESALDFLTKDTPSTPGCLILDIQMPNMSGLELHNILIERRYKHPIIFLSGHGDIDIAVGAVKKGAMDFLQKPIDAERFLSIVKTAVEQDGRYLGNIIKPGELSALVEKLTSREKQIISLLLDDLANKDIADRLDLSQRTVENHRAAAYRKLNVNSITQLKQKYPALKEILEV